MSKKYAVIYLENSYSLRYSEFDADSVYDAVDNAFEIAYREAVQYDEIMDDLAENRERYESDDRPQGYADYANNLIGYIDDYYELITLVDKDDHEAIIGFSNRPFKTVSEMNQQLIERWNASVKNPSDEVYILGDFLFSDSGKRANALLQQLNGKKYLIKEQILVKAEREDESGNLSMKR